MRGLLVAVVLAAAACSQRPRNVFTVGLLGPVSLRMTAEAGRLGLTIADHAPQGTAVVLAATPLKNGSGEVMSDCATLRFLTARAIAEGSEGVFLRLPPTSADNDLLDYTEEWQAATRVVRELTSMRPILEGGDLAAVPFAVPEGIEHRAWTFHGRRYLLLVNASDAPLPLDEMDLTPYRALFAVRSDARQLLGTCGSARCLAPAGVLWLEGRLLPEILP